MNGQIKKFIKSDMILKLVPIYVTISIISTVLRSLILKYKYLTISLLALTGVLCARAK